MIGDGVTDDTDEIQRRLDAGEVVVLESGKSYLITHRLNITKDGSGIVSDGTATLIMGSSEGQFDNTSSAARDRYNTNSVGILAVGVDSPVVEGVHIRLETQIDDRYVRPLAFRDCDNLRIVGNEISNFSKALNLIHIDDSVGGTVSSNYIHDSGTNAGGFAQITGIGTDTDSGQYGASGRGSSNLLIADNTIQDLTVGATFYSLHGYQTDGINIGYQTSAFEIRGNVIDNVGEGIDVFGRGGTIADNHIDDAKLYGLKFIHGASDNLATHNSISNTGTTAIVLVGTATRSRDTANNTIVSNFISGVYEYDPLLPTSAGIAIRSGRGTTYLPRDNLIIGNFIELGGSAEYGLMADAFAGTGNRFVSNEVTGYTRSATSISEDTADLLQVVGTSVGARPWILGSDADDSLQGSETSDALWGGRGNDSLAALSGDDVLVGRNGSDLLYGGDGNDAALYAGPRSAYKVVHVAYDAFRIRDRESADSDGTDLLYGVENAAFSDGTYSLVELTKGVTIDGTASAELIRPINSIGGPLTPSIGDDTISGYGGDDLLNGWQGADAMWGGTGNDIYVVDCEVDRTIELSGEGADTVVALLDWKLSDNIERLRLAGSDSLDGTGNSLANAVIGNSGSNSLMGLQGADLLRGNDGDDWLIGGAGTDLYNGGAGSDVFVLSSPDQLPVDRILDFVGQEDRLAIEGSSFGLEPGSLHPSHFELGGFPTRGCPEFFFDAAKGILFWDGDGALGFSAAIARFAPLAEIDASDFLII